MPKVSVVSKVFYICGVIDEKFIEILEKAGKVFMRYGIKSVTMDDIARELKISKKTLYKYVSDKQDLVNKVMQGYIEMEQIACKDIFNSAENAIDAIIGLTKNISKEILHIHPSIYFDLEKYYPDGWETMQQHKNVFILNCMTDNIQQGVKEGLYRDNVNADIVARIYVHNIDTIFKGSIFQDTDYTYKTLYFESMRYHLRGICSDEGIAYLQNRIKEEHLEL